ncbi:hypothetical protein PRK78_004250 [Emydomyces testavorans]|uniref:Uncharacterized protein n=1 Tax=Emydomyces testavorans TaxID=2070801 RepID=A0AAF0IJD1_9EURO|nr:hypothetical protein PRK78_004250 [Emydomyces testavorans]
MATVAPKTIELQFIDLGVGFGWAGKVPETKKQIRNSMATVLMMFPQILPRKKGGGLTSYSNGLDIKESLCRTKGDQADTTADEPSQDNSVSGNVFVRGDL